VSGVCLFQQISSIPTQQAFHGGIKVFLWQLVASRGLLALDNYTRNDEVLYGEGGVINIAPSWTISSIAINTFGGNQR